MGIWLGCRREDMHAKIWLGSVIEKACQKTKTEMGEEY
jgi:hypothetical protein